MRGRVHSYINSQDTGLSSGDSTGSPDKVKAVMAVAELPPRGARTDGRVPPHNLDAEGVVRGIYKLSAAQNLGPKANLMASGVAVPWALEAQHLLAQDWNIAADVWSVTSWNELRRDGLAADEHNFLHPTEPPQIPYLWSKLAGSEGPYIAVSDYMHAVPDQVRPYVPGDFVTLGADGFGQYGHGMFLPERLPASPRLHAGHTRRHRP